MSSTKEYAGLLRTDGKRPNGLTNMPWQAGKLVVWNVTVADTHADSYLVTTSMTAAVAAELAVTRKEAKYVELSTTHHFVPLAFDFIESNRFQSHEFFKRTRPMLKKCNGQPFGNCVSVPAPVCIALQRLNAVCVLGCFGGKHGRR